MRCSTGLFLAYMLAGGCGGVDAVQPCESNADCFEDSGYICDAGDTQLCLRRCESDADCLASQVCDELPNQALGVCRQSVSSAAD